MSSIHLTQLTTIILATSTSNMFSASAKKSPYTLITPPHSSRSSHAQLPANPPQFSPWSSQAGPSSQNAHEPMIEDLDEEEYDEEPGAEEMEMGTESSSGEEDGSQEYASQRFERLSSLREPSPSGMLVLSADDPEDLDVLTLQDARDTEASLVDLSWPLATTLSTYRAQFSLWESALHPPPSVLAASVLIDQCLAKFVFSLQPLKQISDDLCHLGCSITQFNSFLSQINPHLLGSLETQTQIWNRLGQLEDDSTLVEQSFSDGLNGIKEVCDWVDGILTPGLAQVKFTGASEGENGQVSHLLDLHSYLCDSMVKACTILKIYERCLRGIRTAVQRFQAELAADDAPFSLPGARRWSHKWALSLRHPVNALSVFHSISLYIQLHSAGHLAPLSSGSPATSDSDSILNLPNHLPSCPGPPSGPECSSHSISYS